MIPPNINHLRKKNTKYSSVSILKGLMRNLKRIGLQYNGHKCFDFTGFGRLGVPSRFPVFLVKGDNFRDFVFDTALLK